MLDKARGVDVGCPYLRFHVLDRIKPKLHVFGHIHEHGGKIVDDGATKFVNASVMNEVYDPINPIVNIEL